MQLALQNTGQDGARRIPRRPAVGKGHREVPQIFAVRGHAVGEVTPRTEEGGHVKGRLVLQRTLFPITQEVDIRKFGELFSQSIVVQPPPDQHILADGRHKGVGRRQQLTKDLQPLFGFHIQAHIVLVVVGRVKPGVHIRPILPLNWGPLGHSDAAEGVAVALDILDFDHLRTQVAQHGRTRGCRNPHGVLHNAQPLQRLFRDHVSSSLSRHSISPDAARLPAFPGGPPALLFPPACAG